MTRHAAAAFFMILLSCAGGAAPALAQIAPEGKGPVAITADDLVVHNKDCEAIYSGNAEALQDTSRLRANVMNFFNKKLPNVHPAANASPDSNQNCGELDKMEAHGNVFYVTPTRVVKGDDAIYTADNTTIVMTGTEVVATQGKNVVSGTRLTINTTTGEATMVNDHTGRGVKERVHSVIYPQDNKAPGANGAPAPAAAAAKPAPKPGAPK
ncbi:MAG TPA: LptA/OstA family protein [Caulobacteraceae bacterium]|jgi:lipopolysaccharide export system protein LptA|nr:LptA/OstA family protein [Caulobacteraceae bacterium]